MRSLWKGLFVSVQYRPAFTLWRSELNETWSFVLCRLNFEGVWGRSSKSMLCKVPNFLGKSTFEHKTNKPATPCRPSHPRTWERGNFPEVGKPLGLGSKPRIAPDHCRRHLRRKLRIARILRTLNLSRRWTVCFLTWEAALKILNHGKRVNCKMSVNETL